MLMCALITKHSCVNNSLLDSGPSLFSYAMYVTVSGSKRIPPLENVSVLRRVITFYFLVCFSSFVMALNFHVCF